jgi:hypothetical protein
MHDALRRGMGLVLVTIFLLVWEPDAAGPLDRLVLPLVAAAGAYLVVGSLLAVALSIAALAAIHSDVDAADWVSSRAYPGAAFTAAIVAAVVLVRRFRIRMRDTREARARARTERAEGMQ